MGGGLRRTGKRGGGCNVDTALDGEVSLLGEDIALSLEKASELE